MKLFHLTVMKTSTLQRHLFALNNTIDTLEADNNFLMTRIGELSEINTELDKDLALHKKHLHETTDDFRTQLEDIKHYKAEIASLNDEIDSLKLQLKQARSHKKKAVVPSQPESQNQTQKSHCQPADSQNATPSKKQQESQEKTQNPIPDKSGASAPSGTNKPSARKKK